MTTLKIYSNHSDKLIVTINNIKDLCRQYGIDPSDQELFETEILSDIFEEENINSSEVYYDLSDLDCPTLKDLTRSYLSLYLKE